MRQAISTNVRPAVDPGFYPVRARTTSPKGFESMMLSRPRVTRTAAAVLVTLATAAIAASAADARVLTGKYQGKTSQNLVVKLSVKRHGTRVNFAIPYAQETTCTGNSTFVAGNTDLGKNVRVRRSGAFSFTFSSQQPVTINGQPGATDRYSYTVTGKFKRKHVTGTFQEKDDIYDASGNLYGSCQTTGVTYAARLQPKT
jgi:hypothetical protein